MQNDFLTKLFKVLDFPENYQAKLRSDLGEIIQMNASASLLANLPEGKRSSFIELLKKENVDEDLMRKWFEENNITQNEEFLKKLNYEIKKSIKSFFTALITDLDEVKKGEVLALARSCLS